MKRTQTTATRGHGGVTRRGFLAGAAAGVAGIQIVPRWVLGQAGVTAPSDKVTIAFVGVGSQGLRVMLEFLKESDVQAVAVCDPNKSSADYPQWGKNEFRDAVRRLLGTNSGWDELSPNQPIRLTRTMTEGGGVAGREPCQKIVNAYYGGRNRFGEARTCSAWADFRELLAKEKDVDAVVVGTPDHVHASASIAAMNAGKHVFCQKPMTRTVDEARRMGEVARRKRVATQVAVGNAASEDTRVLCEWVSSGAIGPVRQVVNWSSRPFWPQAIDRPTDTQPVPDGLDWDLWLGPAPLRPFHHVYLPFVWRGWYDFGCGALGDMGCYSFDTIFRVLKLGSPATIEATSTERYPETYPAASIVRIGFPGRGDMPPVTVTWYDGGLKPPRPDDLDDNQKLDAEGLLFVGDKGSILCGFTGGSPRLIPAAKMNSFQKPAKTLPRSPGHLREWLNACKGQGVPAANFEFSAVVTETLALANIALRTGERITWDGTNAKSPKPPSVQEYIAPTRRSGWEL